MNLNISTVVNTIKEKAVSFLLIVSILLASFLTFNYGSFINVSVLHLPEHAAFDGTVPPVKKVPNWVQNDSSKWGASYSELSSDELIPLPDYIPSDLVKSSDGLSWTKASDVLIRNEKITYSTPYMGNYRLDGRENAGSHLAVDIKIPNGTPIYSIANGVVVKVSNQSTGFGHHVVIQHDNAPSYGDKLSLTTLYSSYSHLGAISIAEGDIVVKGQKIAVSGETGTATTPHLHFQIDTDEAPWHPYWPFTWSEAQAAGLDFFSAVNAGLGKEKALKTTVNPMKYVQKYSNGIVVKDHTDDVPDFNGTELGVIDSGKNDNVEIKKNEKDIVTDVEDNPVVVSDPPKLQIEFAVNPTYTEGVKGQYSVFLKDQYGKKFKDGFLGDLIVKSDRGHFTARPSILSLRDFDSGLRSTGVFLRSTPGKDRLKIKYDGDVYYSDWFEINTAPLSVGGVNASPTGDMVAADSDGVSDVADMPTDVKVASSGIKLLFSDVPSTHKYFDAIMYLADKGVIQGYGDGTFRPEKTVSRVEALKFIFLGARLKLNSGKLPFLDTDYENWYGQYLYTAFKRNIVTGYDDGTYRPNNVVSRSEFFKMLFEATDADMDDKVESTFEDVDSNDWFLKYAMHAKKSNVISKSVIKFNPSVGMTRGDVAYAMWMLMK